MGEEEREGDGYKPEESQLHDREKDKEIKLNYAATLRKRKQFRSQVEDPILNKWKRGREEAAIEKQENGGKAAMST